MSWPRSDVGRRRWSAEGLRCDYLSCGVFFFSFEIPGKACALQRRRGVGSVEKNSATREEGAMDPSIGNTLPNFEDSQEKEELMASTRQPSQRKAIANGNDSRASQRRHKHQILHHHAITYTYLLWIRNTYVVHTSPCTGSTISDSRAPTRIEPTCEGRSVVCWLTGWRLSSAGRGI